MRRWLSGKSCLLWTVIVFLAFSLIHPIHSQSLDLKKLHGIKPRSIGPAGMSGRVTSIDVVLSNPDIIYAGTASGGLWKSTSGGVDWQPIFDDQDLAAIGAVAVDQNNPDVIWVGSGEGNPRNSQSSGNGVYKSINGGKTWEHLGLEESRNIHRLILDPRNSDVAYVAAQGPAWGETSERGIFKTTDGGKNWKKILFANTKTGAADLVMDPRNPNKLIAAMWEFRRWPWFFKSGGEGSGLHVTFDGGETWEKRTDEDGLPKGELGRIGLAIAHNNPQVVYALVESKKNALFRSDDGGFKWRKISDKNIGNRPFYYADIYVDPSNENRIYNLHSTVTKSEDGGKTFSSFVSWSTIHPDHHAWWVHPDDPDFMIDGNDGGLAITRDRGKTWRFVENLPLAQFYHINIDMDIPYNVYGGMQDNGSWKGPSQVWRWGGIRNSYWEEVGFGDGFDVVPDPENSRYGYAMWQGGNLMYYDSETGESQYIRPIDLDDTVLRFNWNAGIAQDPYDPATIYYGSQFLHKSTDRGQTWQTISPDLTTNDPEKQKQLESGGLTYDVTQAENYTSILAIAPSALEKDVIWVGTDDGNVQLTRDGGANWTNVATKMKGVPTNAWVPQVHASTYDAAEAFVVLNNYRQNDWTPYVYHTKNYGKSWTRLVDENDVYGYALSFAQDPTSPNLMFTGTESGLYVSIDAGTTWTKWTEGYPTVSTMDMKIHPRDYDLIIGTFGRSAYIFDDIRPLQALAKDGIGLLDKPLHLYDIPDAYLASFKQAAGTRFYGASHFSGDNRGYGARISFSINPDALKSKETTDEDAADGEEKKAVSDTVTVRILSAAGDTLRTLRVKAKPGLNRISWNLNRKGVRYPSQAKPKPGAAEPGGASVLPGTYTVALSYNDQQASGKIKVHFDPRFEFDAAMNEKADEAYAQMYANIELATAAADRIREAKKIIKNINAQLTDRKDDDAKAVKEKGKALQDSLKSLDELINQTDGLQGIYGDPERLGAKIWRTMNYIGSAWTFSQPVSAQMVTRFEKQLNDIVEQVDDFFQSDWPEYQSTVDAAKISFFKPYEPLKQ